MKKAGPRYQTAICLRKQKKQITNYLSPLTKIYATNKICVSVKLLLLFYFQPLGRAFVQRLNKFLKLSMPCIWVVMQKFHFKFSSLSVFQKK